MTTTRIIAKPHIAQYLRSRYEKDGVIVIPARSLVFSILASALTADPMQRLGAAPSPKYQVVEVRMPQEYRQSYLSAEMAEHAAALLEKDFWNEARLFIYQRLTDPELTIFKDEAIKLFYAHIQLTESLYPIGHFRRQLTRKQLTGTRSKKPTAKNRLSKKLTNEQCMIVYRGRKKISYRRMASHFKVHHTSISRLISKLIDREKKRKLISQQ